MKDKSGNLKLVWHVLNIKHIAKWDMNTSKWGWHISLCVNGGQEVINYYILLKNWLYSNFEALMSLQSEDLF